MTDGALTDAQLQELEEGSGISRATIDAARVFGSDSPKLLAKLTRRPREAWDPEAYRPALVFPYFIPGQADPVLWNVKPAIAMPPPPDTKGGKPIKYVRTSKISPPPYFPPDLLAHPERLTDPAIPKLLTEGEKKALSAESAGFTCLSFSGVHMWGPKAKRGETKKLHPLLHKAAAAGGDFFIVYDSDAAENLDVRGAENWLAEALAHAGARVYVVRLGSLDGAKVGLDDYLVRHGDDALRAELAAARERGAIKIDPNGRWLVLLSTDDKGRRLRSVGNGVKIFAHDPRWQNTLAYDERGDRVLFLRPPPFPEYIRGTNVSFPRELIDEDATRATTWIETEHEISLGTDITRKAIDAVAHEKPIDEVRDYLEALRWDEAPRADSWLVAFLGCDDTPLVRAFGARWLISAVARALNPGCKADHVLVLEGPQGIRKSSALRQLFGAKWFTDDIPDLGSKEAALHLQGVWCVELAELDAMSRAELSATKRFLSAAFDRYRAPYGHRPKTHQRRCVFAGSTNDSTYLRDSTGNRRFWPVACGRTGPIDVEALGAARDQLWAEATARYRAGERWYLDDDGLVEAARDAQEERHLRDEWESLISSYIHSPQTGLRGYVTLHEVLADAVKLDKARWSQTEQTRVAKALVRLGWTRRQARLPDGRREWRYAPVVDLRGTVGGNGAAGSNGHGGNGSAGPADVTTSVTTGPRVVTGVVTENASDSAHVTTDTTDTSISTRTHAGARAHTHARAEGTLGVLVVTGASGDGGDSPLPWKDPDEIDPNDFVDGNGEEAPF